MVLLERIWQHKLLLVGLQGRELLILLLHSFDLKLFSSPPVTYACSPSFLQLFVHVCASRREALYSDIHGGEGSGRVSCGQAFGTVLALAKHFSSGRQEIIL